MGSKLNDTSHWVTLVGTAGSWFLFDVAFYGTAIFTPNILKKVFGAQQTLSMLTLRSLFTFLVQILGNATGLLAVNYFGAKTQNTVGLALSSLGFTAFMLVYAYAPDRTWTLFALVCILGLVLCAGPGVATFVLPVQSFPQEVRSTFHGLSAAAAKVGAMTGALLFPLVLDNFGVPAVMAVQAVVCLTGAILSHFFVRSASALEFRVVSQDSSSDYPTDDFEAEMVSRG